MKRFLTALALAVVVLPLGHQNAMGSFVSGDFLLKSCSGKLLSEKAFCSGFIAAVSDLLREDRTVSYSVCLPKGTTLEQLQKIVNSWLGKHHKYLNYSASSLVGTALSDTFPCQK